MQPHIHIIGIGGIGVSALARYYRHEGYRVSGSDMTDSLLLDTLRAEGFDITIGHDADTITPDITRIVYSEAIITQPDLATSEQIYANPELDRARDLGIPHDSYPVALAEIFDTKRGIAIAGSHGKSTTTALVGMIASNAIEGTKNDSIGASVLVGTQVPQFSGSNFLYEKSPNFVIEACEYKRSFLAYHPSITVITNIDLDHLDYYQDLSDYIAAFQALVDQTSDYVIVSSDDANSARLDIPITKKILVGKYSDFVAENFSDLEIPDDQKHLPHIFYAAHVHDLETDHITYESHMIALPDLELQIPGEHILHDAHLAYAVGRLLGVDDTVIRARLALYHGSWRRMEIVRTTIHGNILMSDYGHHPSEIRPTLQALHLKYPARKLFIVFQPHQYSRTRELLADFAQAFTLADTLMIPNIYFSRDKKEDVEWMTTDRLVDVIRPHNPHVYNGEGLQNTLTMIKKYDQENPDTSIILLLGAGNVDTLRADIE